MYLYVCIISHFHVSEFYSIKFIYDTSSFNYAIPLVYSGRTSLMEIGIKLKYFEVRIGSKIFSK